jgi:hypothetical protein
MLHRFERMLATFRAPIEAVIDRLSASLSDRPEALRWTRMGIPNGDGDALVFILGDAKTNPAARAMSRLCSAAAFYLTVSLGAPRSQASTTQIHHLTR